MTVDIIESVPWSYTDEPGVLQWTWLTPHFVARITGTEVATEESVRFVRSYAWSISDLVRQIQGVPRLIVDGSASSFEEAEDRVREHIGKCYDPRLGYRPYAGPLAFRFALSTGEVVDVSPYIGTRCVVTVLLPDRSERTVSGEFDVRGYRWRLLTQDEVLEIVPEHVVRISNRSEAADRASAVVHGDTYSGIGRIYRQDPRPGCTGRAGFLVGTVDHAGCPQCPLHEAGIPRHLLR
jgi:hypothetical protein